MNQMGIEIHNL